MISKKDLYKKLERLEAIIINISDEIENLNKKLSAQAHPHFIKMQEHERLEKLVTSSTPYEYVPENIQLTPLTGIIQNVSVWGHKNI